MKAVAVALLSLMLAACGFGVPIGGQPSPQVASNSSMVIDSSGKAKYGNPKSYVVNGERYYVMESAKGFAERGIASWYGPNFHGKRTSSGVTYDMHAMTAAHRTLPLPTRVKVENLSNGKSVVVLVNDRGPFAKNRVIDLSYAAAKKLDMVGPGTAEVEVTALTGPGDTRATVRAIPLPAPAAPDEGGEIFLQLGSFSNEINAINLRSRLNSDKEQAIVISSIETGSGTFYRVRVGPLLDVNEALAIQRRLRDKGYGETRIVVGDE